MIKRIWRKYVLPRPKRIPPGTYAAVIKNVVQQGGTVRVEMELLDGSRISWNIPEAE